MSRQTAPSEFSNPSYQTRQGRSIDDNVYDDASSNVDYQKRDYIIIQPSSPTSDYQGQIQESLSPHGHHPPVYQPLLNDAKFTSAVEKEQDRVDEYDYIQSPEVTEGKQYGDHSAAGGRPLPVVPFNIYEPLNMTTTSTDDGNIMSHRVRSFIPKIVLLLTAITAIVVTTVVVTVILLKMANDNKLDDNPGKNNGSENVWNITTTTTTPTAAPTTPALLNARAFLGNSTLLSVIPGSESMLGITVLGSELFVLRRKSVQATVYNTNNFTWNRNISITGSSGDLYAILASPRFNRLYISDTGGLDAVFRYNLSNNVITKESSGGTCLGLSLTSTDNLISTLSNTRKIREYTPDWTMIREIQLDGSMEYPMHSVQLSSDKFVVSHGWRKSMHRVCIVDTSGIIKCYGGAQGSGVGQLNYPSHFVVDGHGNVLVADRDNNRVVLLSPTLDHLGYFVMPNFHQLSYPWALHLDELTRRLYIGESPSTSVGRVFVLAV